MGPNEYDPRIAMVSTYRPPPPPPKKRKRRWGLMLVPLLVLVATPPLAFVGAEASALRDPRLPALHKLSDYRPPALTQIFASNGELIATTGGARLLADHLPPALSKAIIARVDPGFLTHERLTQQDVANALLDRLRGIEPPARLSLRLAESLDDDALGPEHDLMRTLKDYLVAMRLEHDLTRPELLLLYANQRPFGGEGYGVELGARDRFGKPLDELDPEQLVALAGLDDGKLGTASKKREAHAAECGEVAAHELALRFPADVLTRLGANVTTTCDVPSIVAAQRSIAKRGVDELGLSASVAVMRLPGHEVVTLVGAPLKPHPIGVLRSPFVIGAALDTLKWTAITPVTGTGMALRAIVGRSPGAAAEALLAADLAHAPIIDIATKAGFAGGEDIVSGKAPITTLQAADLLGTLALDGTRQQPQLVTSVVRPGEKAEPQEEPTTLQALSPEVVSLLTEFLSRPVRTSLNRPSAGLTGTDRVGTWLGVYLPNLAIAVWLGPNGSGKPTKSLEVEKLAVEIALDVIAVDLKGAPALKFARAPKLFARRVDDKGALVPRGTPGGTEEWFIPGSVHREEDELAPDPSQDADPTEKN